jgi:cytochrome c
MMQSTTRKRMVKNSIVAAALIAVPVLSLAQDAQKGKTVFNVSGLPRDRSRCAKQDWPRTQRARRRKAGTVPNFDYSDANKSSGIVWNEATFEDYIKNPAAGIMAALGDRPL